MCLSEVITACGDAGHWQQTVLALRQMEATARTILERLESVLRELLARIRCILQFLA